MAQRGDFGQRADQGQHPDFAQRAERGAANGSEPPPSVPQPRAASDSAAAGRSPYRSRRSRPRPARRRQPRAAAPRPHGQRLRADVQPRAAPGRPGRAAAGRRRAAAAGLRPPGRPGRRRRPAGPAAAAAAPGAGSAARCRHTARSTRRRRCRRRTVRRPTTARASPSAGRATVGGRRRPAGLRRPAGRPRPARRCGPGALRRLLTAARRSGAGSARLSPPRPRPPARRSPRPAHRWLCPARQRPRRPARAAPDGPAHPPPAGLPGHGRHAAGEHPPQQSFSGGQCGGWSEPDNRADDRFAAFRPDQPTGPTAPRRTEQPAPKERNGRVLVLVSWPLAPGRDPARRRLLVHPPRQHAFNPAIGECVKQSGDTAVTAGCGEAGAFLVVCEGRQPVGLREQAGVGRRAQRRRAAGCSACGPRAPPHPAARPLPPRADILRLVGGSFAAPTSPTRPEAGQPRVAGAVLEQDRFAGRVAADVVGQAAALPSVIIPMAPTLRSRPGPHRRIRRTGPARPDRSAGRAGLGP